MKKPLVVCNWKMYVEKQEGARALARALRSAAGKYPCETLIAAPFPLIPIVAGALKRSKVSVGAQTVSSQESGAHTGEVSAAMLKDAGAQFVIIGHSERRALGESDDTIAAQVAAALARTLKVVLCVGEQKRDTEHGEHFEIVGGQLNKAFAGLSAKAASKIIVAYEPVWAIGTTADKAVSPADMQETAIFIRKQLVDIFGRAAALKIPILYGGSVDSTNAGALFRQGAIAGFLVGRASANAEKFTALIKTICAQSTR